MLNRGKILKYSLDALLKSLSKKIGQQIVAMKQDQYL